MRNKILKLWLLFSLLVIFTRSYSQTPIEINNTLAGYTDSLYKLGGEWGTKYNDLKTTKKFGELLPYRMRMKNFVDQAITEILKMKDVKGSKDLQDATLKFLYFEKHMISTTFLPIEKLSENATDKEIKDAFGKITTASLKEDEKIKDISKAQQAYAEKNGFKIAGH